MDFIMPIMDGPMTTRAVRELGFKGFIIGLTGQLQEQEKHEFMESGVDKVLSKPVDLVTLEMLLRQYAAKLQIIRRK
jgi:two-component system capsular synthesis sensor histidine kinase RcsC